MSQAVSQLRTKISRATRNAVCGIQPYWTKPVVALNHLVDLLETHGLFLEQEMFSLNDGCDGRCRLDLIDADRNEMPSMLIMVWHRMPSGEKFEVTAYLS